MGLNPPSTDHRAWIDDPLECGGAAGFGVYLHVPFCAHRCGYCDFATEAVGDVDASGRQQLYSRYVAALRDDLARQVAAGRGAHAPRGTHVDDAWPQVTSVFVGGGTPTILPPGLLVHAIDVVGEELDLADDVEITVECNPETATDELFDALVDAGVTRVSMGVQSYTEHVLAVLERRHTPGVASTAVRMARRAGIPSVNLDVIYGTPGESDANWADTLRNVLSAGVDHVSAYALTVHGNTPFGRRVADGSIPAPDDDVQRNRFEVARSTFSAAGFDHYEISNWARGPGLRSRHNVLYWQHGDYLGVGVGAHGHLAGRRWWSTRSTDKYLTAVETGTALGPGPSPAVTSDEELSSDERAAERLLLGLRLRDGLHPRDVPPLPSLAVEDAVGAGLINLSCGRVQCTDEGWFLLDEAVTRLLA